MGAPTCSALLFLLKIVLGAETMLFRTGTGYRPWSLLSGYLSGAGFESQDFCGV